LHALYEVTDKIRCTQYWGGDHQVVFEGRRSCRCSCIDEEIEEDGMDMVVEEEEEEGGSLIWTRPLHINKPSRKLLQDFQCDSAGTDSQSRI